MPETTWESASEIKARHEDRIIGMRGVHGIGIGDHGSHGGTSGSPCIVIMVDETAGDIGLPESLEAVPLVIVRAPPSRQQ